MKLKRERLVKDFKIKEAYDIYKSPPLFYDDSQ